MNFSVDRENLIKKFDLRELRNKEIRDLLGRNLDSATTLQELGPECLSLMQRE